VAVGRERGEEEPFSCDGVGEGKLVAEAAVVGRGATVGVGSAVGTAAEQADPTTTVTAKIKTGNLLFTVWTDL